MTVVADARPLQYIFRAGCINVLPALYGQVIVPRVIVAVELAHEFTPSELRDWLKQKPPWLVVHEGEIAVPDFAVGLGTGEKHAIGLAIQNAGSLLLCDDAVARKRAMGAGIRVKGTLGILDDAGVRGMIDFDDALDRLIVATNFRHSRALLDRVRAIHRGRLPSPKEPPRNAE